MEINRVMRIELISIGKTDNQELNKLIDHYVKRLAHYIKFDFTILPDIKNVKNLSKAEQKKAEANSILKFLQKSDFIVLLDENGRGMSSEDFAQYLQKRMNASTKKLVFIIGGPYGFDPMIYERADQKISLSKMTFSHQMVRLFFCEQLYRGFSILNNEPYHHS